MYSAVSKQQTGKTEGENKTQSSLAATLRWCDDCRENYQVLVFVR